MDPNQPPFGAPVFPNTTGSTPVFPNMYTFGGFTQNANTWQVQFQHQQFATHIPSQPSQGPSQPVQMQSQPDHDFVSLGVDDQEVIPDTQ